MERYPGELEDIKKFLEKLKDPVYLENLKKEFTDAPTPKFDYLKCNCKSSAYYRNADGTYPPLGSTLQKLKEFLGSTKIFWGKITHVRSVKLAREELNGI